MTRLYFDIHVVCILQEIMHRMYLFFSFHLRQTVHAYTWDGRESRPDGDDGTSNMQVVYAATAADIGGHVVGQTLHGVYTVYNGKLVIIIIADKYMKTIHIMNSMENYQLVI